MIHRFTGHIAASGHADGTTLILGAWHKSERGPFADVMIRHGDGRRELIAPDNWVADFVSTTYDFDTVTITPVDLRRSSVRGGGRWRISAGQLRWSFTVGRRAPLGYLLRLQPPRIPTLEPYARLISPIARTVMNGVDTWGSAGAGRTEWYSATDLHYLTESSAQYAGVDLGPMAPVGNPEVGFSAPPPRPSLTALTSSVRQ